MRGNIRFSNPDTMQKPPGYSHVVEVTGPGRTVYFAGQLGIDKSGRMGTNAHEQMKIAFENVKAALASVGAGFELSSNSTTISSISASISRITAKCGTST
jgi:enamine deaminase RidA (YjgF/YER057c/UK114 family)